MRYCIAVFLASIHQTFQNHTHWSSFQKKKLHLEKHATHKHPICTTCCVAKDLYSPKIAVFLLLVSIQSIYCQKIYNLLSNYTTPTPHLATPLSAWGSYNLFVGSWSLTDRCFTGDREWSLKYMHLSDLCYIQTLHLRLQLQKKAKEKHQTWILNCERSAEVSTTSGT